MKCSRDKLAAIVVAAVVCTVGVWAQGATVDPRARTAIEQMEAAYKSLDALHVKVTWTARYSGSMSRDDFPLPGPDTLELRMQRPNKFYMEAFSKGGERPSRYVIVCDGSNLWYWRSVPNTYTQVAAPATLADMPGLLPSDAIGTFDGLTWTNDTILEWDLLFDEVATMKDFAESGLAITLGAPTKIGNAAVDVVQIKDPAVPGMPLSSEVTYYLSASSHLIQGWHLITRGQHPDNGKDFSVTMRADYDVHETHPQFTAKDFTFTPPRGARKVDTVRKDRNPSE